MDRNEQALVKKTLLSVNDWDGFQEAIRRLAKLIRALAPEARLSVKNS